MTTDLNDLEERITGLADEQLILMVTVEHDDYRPEAMEFALELPDSSAGFTNPANNIPGWPVCSKTFFPARVQPGNRV